MGLPWLLIAGWIIVAVLTYAVTRQFLERLRIELHEGRMPLRDVIRRVRDI
jgi:hypothetical protein